MKDHELRSALKGTGIISGGGYVYGNNLVQHMSGQIDSLNKILGDTTDHCKWCNRYVIKGTMKAIRTEGGFSEKVCEGCVKDAKSKCELFTGEKHKKK